MEPKKSESSLLLEKINEQVSLADHLLSLVPASALEWRPEAPKTAVEDSGSELMRMGDLLGHLLDCMAGFCALLYSIKRQHLGHFGEMRDRQVNHFCGIEEARVRMREYMSRIEEGFAVIDDADLRKLQATVFVPKGEPVLTLLLGNLEHLINHKHQLFMYLRLLGVTVGTRDLYRFRGE